MSSKISLLKDRAGMLAEARQFFSQRGVIEVDCPLVSASASVDLHIDLIPVDDRGQRRYLHSSPEYGMKRLLSQGMGDIYQLSHVFRLGEKGSRHNPEFMMAEWYRLGISFEEMIEETLAFVRLFLGDLPSETLSYQEAFQRYAGIDPYEMSAEELYRFLGEGYPDLLQEGKDALLHLILAEKVEPFLGKEVLTVICDYPASQCALACVKEKGGVQVAERFEIYFRGVELSNGYHELTDAKEQRARFELANAERLLHGKEALPIDEPFLAALENGLPDCCGVAVGFDRLMMLRHSEEKIRSVIPFDWDHA